MSKVTIIIEDKDDEVMIHGTVDPFMTEGKLIFSTAEIVGLYMQDNIAKEPSLIILPGAQL